ncbi:MAG TPA: SulP family inorganic anion transporter, partial [Psychrobacter sp.]|uniref:SulP family inorganic anion transporter n=1 Tax=Psychrobacter sp. TaxID=56811 RepID=UPI002CA20C32
MLNTIKDQWLSNIKGDVLAGMVVALALIPEAIAFSIIAGVDPQVGLYASFCIAVVIAFVGGRPAMISAATGAMALLMVTLVKDHGLQYLLAATVLTGVLQVVFGFLKLGNLMKYVSQSVIIGFINALAILIFMSQLPELMPQAGSNLWHVYALVALGLIIIYGYPYVPKIGKIIPSPLVCIVLVTILAIVFGAEARTISDMGQLPDTLPIFLLPNIPLNVETLLIIL